MRREETNEDRQESMEKNRTHPPGASPDADQDPHPDSHPNPYARPDPHPDAKVDPGPKPDPNPNPHPHPDPHPHPSTAAAGGLPVNRPPGGNQTGTSDDEQLLRFKRQRLIVFVALLLTYGYFTPAAQWNENSRYNLTRSIVERGRLNIDPYHENTGDKSYRAGHFYSDKAPGTSFLAVPGYALFVAARRLAGQSLPAQEVEVWPGETDPDTGKVAHTPRMKYSPAFWRGLYMANLLSNALLAAFAGFLLFGLLMRRTSGNLVVSLFGVTAYSLGTMAFSYATLFYGHQVAGSLLLIGFCLIERLSDHAPGEDFFSRPVVAYPLLGVVCGVSVTAEYPAAIACGLLCAYAVYRAGPGERLKSLAFIAAGGAPFAVLLGLYHTACFGGPLKLGYQFLIHERFARGMSQGLMGVTWPRPWIALQILVGNHRGLFYLSPVLLLAGLGLYRMWKNGHRLEVALVSAVSLYFLGLNSAYYMWDGGAASGPRHMIPMLGFLAPAVARAFPRSHAKRLRWARAGCWFLLAISVANMLALTAVGAEAPMDVWDPLMEYAWPNFLTGEVALNAGATNVGLMFRLPGTISVLPLLAIWAIAAAAMVLSERSGSTAPGRSGSVN